MHDSDFVAIHPGLVHNNRELGLTRICLSGAAIGALCYCLAESTIGPVDSPFFHDLHLAGRLGFIYPAAVAFWLGWYQRSWRRAIAGIPLALTIGVIYTFLILSGNFLMIMVGFPCLLGGGFASILGSTRSNWANDFFLRLLKGFVAGLGLGVTYMIVLNVCFGVFYNSLPGTGMDLFVSTMWRAGPIALAAGSTVFVLGILWATGLKRVTLKFETDPGVGLNRE